MHLSSSVISHCAPFWFHSTTSYKACHYLFYPSHSICKPFVSPAPRSHAPGVQPTSSPFWSTLLLSFSPTATLPPLLQYSLCPPQSLRAYPYQLHLHNLELVCLLLPHDPSLCSKRHCWYQHFWDIYFVPPKYILLSLHIFFSAPKPIHVSL